MKDRLKFLWDLYAVVVLVFMLQKPFFMALNLPEDNLAFIDWIRVMLHGLTLDMATSGYIIALPLLLSMLSVWVPKLPLRAILTPYYAIISLIVSIVFIADTSLYSFWQFKIDSTVLMYAATPKEALASVSVGYVLFRILLIAVYAVVLTFLFAWLTPKRFAINRNRVLTTILQIVSGIIIFFIIRGGFGMSTTNVGQAYFSDRQFLNHSAINPLFNILYSLGKSGNYAAEYNYLPENEREAIFSRMYACENDSLTTKFVADSSPNLLFIILEGFGASFIEETGGRSDVTPNFSRLASQGVLFTNCYGNSFRTDRGVVSALSGYLGLPNTSIMKMPSKSKSLPSIAGTLVRKGYKTDFIYGGDINFTNMQSYLRGTGYQSIISDTDFSLADRHTNAWGVNDHIVFNRVYDIISARDTSQRWMTTILSLSSHEPFEVPYRRLKEDVPNSMAYTDSCLGDFINKLRELPSWRNMLVVITADHGIYYPMEGLRSRPQFFGIPLLFTGGAVNRTARIDLIMNQSDIAATLFAQLGIDHSDFSFSRNVLTPDYPDREFACYTFFNGFGVVDPQGVTVYDHDGAKTVFTTDAATDSLRLLIGKSAVQTIYDDLGTR